MHAKSFQSCPALCDPMDCSPPGSVHGISQAKYWSGLPFPPPGHLPRPEIESESPALAGEFLTIAPPGKPQIGFYIIYVNKHPLEFSTTSQGVHFSSVQSLSGVRLFATP